MLGSRGPLGFGPPHLPAIPPCALPPASPRRLRRARWPLALASPQCSIWAPCRAASPHVPLPPPPLPLPYIYTRLPPLCQSFPFAHLHFTPGLAGWPPLPTPPLPVHSSLQPHRCRHGPCCAARAVRCAARACCKSCLAPFLLPPFRRSLPRPPRRRNASAAANATSTTPFDFFPHSLSLAFCSLYPCAHLFYACVSFPVSLFCLSISLPLSPSSLYLSASCFVGPAAPLHHPGTDGKR